MTQWSQAMQERAQTGESIDEFCERMGISRNKFFYWQRKLRDAVCEKLETTPGAELALPSFSKVIVKDESVLPLGGTSAGLCIEVGGVRISADAGYPPDKLAALLRGLR
jgi:putative transposase